MSTGLLEIRLLWLAASRSGSGWCTADVIATDAFELAVLLTAPCKPF